MAESTLISWTDHTFNAWMGCEKVSEGCRNCYALTLTKNRMGLDLWGRQSPRQITKQPWKNVLAWEKSAAHGERGILGPGMPHLVFLGSLMDWAEDRDDLIAVRNRMWNMIRSCRHLHFQMLTKRAENIVRFLPDDWGGGYENVWLGTSIEDMRVASRADILRKIPAAVRFVSYEPALGPLDDLDLTGIDWVIYGGESGSGYRPEGTLADPKCWARSMGNRCDSAGVAYFHKQSAAFRTEMGVELDGEVRHQFPIWRKAAAR